MNQTVRWAGWMAIVMGMLVTASWLANVAVAEQRPNMIFVMTDDQGYGDVGFMGHPHLRTPVLDQMAHQGLQMHRFYAAAPRCSPTRASVLTGRHPNRSGVFSFGHALRPQEHSIATALREAGYRTGLFGKWHLGSVRAGQPTSPDGHGFEVWSAAPNFYVNDPWFSRNGQPVQVQGEGSAVTVAEAMPFIREAVQQGRPFFAVIWFGAPHTPHEATEELQALYPDLPRRLRNYYGEITGVDQAVGTLRQELRRLGIAENTLLIFTSDNGGQPGDGAEHLGLRGAKSEVWEGGIRVPAVVEWPGRIGPGITHVPASTVDLYPTFLEIAGVCMPHERPMDGISLVPLFEGRMQKRPQPLGFWEYMARRGQRMRSDQILQQLFQQQQTGGEVRINEGQLLGPELAYEEADDRPGHSVWMDNEWKLHRRPNGRFLLFNLRHDQGEQHNVIEQHPDIADRMKRELNEWEESVIRSLRGADY